MAYLLFNLVHDDSILVTALVTKISDKNVQVGKWYGVLACKCDATPSSIYVITASDNETCV